LSNLSGSNAFKIISKFSDIIFLFSANLSGVSSGSFSASLSESIALINDFCFFVFFFFGLGLLSRCFGFSFFLIGWGSSGSESYEGLIILFIGV